ncbi:hypothetical protein MOQ_003441 [Trypanosoma cruzi marinkellei]|uniref:3-hydroxyacyl-CoA dehydrogenase C-terminal domain-containing protein n=1 Tax=Trypanosoma cruzi marinkellei TaxID=85056 RepID=K2N466_TRYCR|nr:hypothetical protein MOQ_003441 [Trypanosoma cruzi marinkellei]
MYRGRHRHTILHARMGHLVRCTVRRFVATSFSDGAHGSGVSRGSGREINALLREINDLWVRRGVSEHKISVSASKLRPTLATAMTDRDPVQPHGSFTIPAAREDTPRVPVITKEPPVLTDIACTLQELEEELFKLSADEAAVTEPPNSACIHELKMENEHEENEKDAVPSFNRPNEPQHEAMNSAAAESPAASCSLEAPCHHEKLSCWMDAEESKPLHNSVTLHVSKSSDRIFVLELREQPLSARDVVLAVSQALNEVESSTELSEGLVVVFRSVSSISFFTPLLSEMELSYLARAELLRAKERLFCRMREATLCGVSFVAELNHSAFNIGAELFFMCDRKIIPESEVCGGVTKVGFPSVSAGVWPAPCVVQCISSLLGYGEKVGLVVPIMHTIPWSELSERYPQLLKSDRTSQRLQEKVYRLFKLQWDRLSELLGWRTDRSAKKNRVNFLLRHWDNYCALVDTTQGGTDSVLDFTASSQGISMYVTLLGTSDFCNAASVTMALRRMRHRVLNPPPRGSIIELRPTDRNSITVDESFCVFTEASSPETVRFIAERRSFSGNGVIKSALLMGDIEGVKDAADLLDCAVVATNLRPSKLCTLAEGGDMVEVQLLCLPHVSKILRRETLTSALGYLQSKGIPYIVSKGDAGNRLVAALSLELCRLATEAEMQLIDAVAREELRFCINPFQLLDCYGMMYITQVMGRHPHLLDERQVPSITRRVLSAMDAEGFGGEGSHRGGFYNRYGSLNPEVRTEFLRRRKLSRGDIFLRLLFALVNESCRMLLEGCVETVDDIDLLSIGALTLNLSTGGLLSYVDSGIGCFALLRNMDYLSREMGVTASPSPLLQVMLEAGETFRTLSPETLYQARQKVVGRI